MAPTKCVYFMCNNTSDQKPMFRFPSGDPKRLQVWLSNCGNMTIAHLSDDALRNRYVCLDHFRKEFVRNEGGRRTRITKKAVPKHYREEENNSPHSEIPSTSRVAEVRRKWSHIRNSYSRHLRNELHGGVTGRGRAVSGWYLAHEMRFLRPHMATDSKGTSAGAPLLTPLPETTPHSWAAVSDDAPAVDSLEGAPYFHFFKGLYEDYQELSPYKQRCLLMLHELIGDDSRAERAAEAMTMSYKEEGSSADDASAAGDRLDAARDRLDAAGDRLDAADEKPPPDTPFIRIKLENTDDEL